MMRRLVFLAIIYLCSLPTYSEGATVKFSSSCTVDQCNSSNQNGGCSSSNICYSFQTSKNTTLCAPQIDCSLFDACTSTKACASNKTVCVLNSCCSIPICMPIALASACSSTSNATTIVTTPSTSTAAPANVCSNPIWNDIEEVMVNLLLTSNYSMYVGDFHVDKKNNYFVADSNGRRIIKIEANNTSTFTVVGVSNTTFDYAPTHVFVDYNGTIYAAETWYNNSFYGSVTYFRVVKYVEDNGTTGIVLFGEVICGNQMDQICSCGGLSVDNQGFIYYSDVSNNRIVKITPFATTVAVVAGTSGVAGSMTNQLNFPGGIYVDTDNTLYVADRNNNRVVMYLSGSLFGTVLFTVGANHSPGQLTLDNSRNIYISSYGGIYRLSRGSTFPRTIIQLTYGGLKIQLDTTGNIYTTTTPATSFIGNILKYQLISNAC